MNRDEMRAFMVQMSHSQGCWGRKLREIEESEYSDSIWTQLELMDLDALGLMDVLGM